MRMTIEEVNQKINKLISQRCDCVMSIRASAMCLRCAQLYILYNMRAETALKEVKS